MFLRKQKQNPRMSMGRRNVSSSLGQKKEQSEETQRWKALGQRSSPCYGQSILKSLIWGDTAVWILAGFQHSSLVQNIQICVTVHVLECARPCFYLCVKYVHERHCARVFTISICLLMLTCYTVYVCMIPHVCVCVFDRLCVFSDSRGLQKVGPSVWEQRGGVNDYMKETQDNKPLE